MRPAAQPQGVRPHRMKPINLLPCNAIAVVVGLVSFAVAAAIQFPGTFRDPMAAAVVATAMYFSGPLVAASVLALWRRHAAPLYIHILLSLGWWGFLVYPWARKPWLYYGAFPWAGVMRLWVPILPSILLVGIAFWAVSSRVNKDAV